MGALLTINPSVEFRAKLKHWLNEYICHSLYNGLHEILDEKYEDFLEGDRDLLGGLGMLMKRR